MNGVFLRKRFLLLEKMNNVIDKITKKSRCCGCGICAGIAEKCDLKMRFNENGEFVPVVTNCSDCGYCLSICPSWNNSSNQKQSQSPLGGEHIECFVGYSTVKNERTRGSSGALVTRISKVLLEKNIVNGVIMVGKSDKKDRFFEPIIARTAQEVDACAGSKYYPIEFSSVLKILNKERGKYAFIGLPCVVNGLRLIQQRNPEIGSKIKYLFGLVCGHNKNKNYTSFLIELEGVKEKNVETVIFRSKENTKKAINYGFKSILKDGGIGKQLNFMDSLVKDVWCKRYFSLGVCFRCYDLFAEQADISFMDAWLNPYMDDPRGTSIIVVRNQELKNLIEEEKSKAKCVIVKIDEKEVIKSQKGALDFKNSMINKKKKFLFNKWLSGKFYHEEMRLKSIGATILKTHIAFFRN